MKTQKSTMTKEKVSTVGIRNQVTMPKMIRESLKMTAKATAYIKTVDKGKEMVITLEEPEEGIYNRIKISEKGQLVVPKNLRESMGIKEGTNLLFKNVTGGIHVIKLEEIRKEKETLGTWQLVHDFLTILKKHELEPSVKEKNLLVKGGKDMKYIVELEKLMETRVMVEKTAEGIVLSPIG